MVLIHWHIVVKIYIVNVKHHGTHPLTYCCKDLHSKGKTSWYSSIDILLKILNIDHSILSYSKNRFNTILQQIVHTKYMNDWQQRNESMKNGKLKTYLALKTNFGLEKYLTILNNFHYKRSICRLRISSNSLQIENLVKCSENKVAIENNYFYKFLRNVKILLPCQMKKKYFGC